MNLKSVEVVFAGYPYINKATRAFYIYLNIDKSNISEVAITIYTEQSYIPENYTKRNIFLNLIKSYQMDNYYIVVYLAIPQYIYSAGDVI